jgi:hypothetical protein
MLSAQDIEVRITNYACCALEFFGRYVDNTIVGETKCAEMNWSIAMYLKEAQRMMCDSDCVDAKLLAEVACIADQYCDNCPCTEPADPNDVDCTIVPSFTVIAVIPADEIPIPCSINLDWNNDWSNDFNADIPCVNVQPGDSYYVTTGVWAGQIITWAAEPDFNNDFNNDFNAQQ